MEHDLSGHAKKMKAMMAMLNDKSCGMEDEESDSKESEDSMESEGKESPSLSIEIEGLTPEKIKEIVLGLRGKDAV